MPEALASRPLRVLQVVGALEMGGAEVMAVALGETVSRSERVDYLVLSQAGGGLESRAHRHGAIIHRFPAPRKIGAARFVIRLMRLLRESRYDVVHSHINLASGWVLLAARLAGVRVRLAHAHSTSVERPGLAGKVYGHAARLLIRTCATRYLACGQDAAVAFFGSEWNARPSAIIRNGVLVDDFLTSRLARSDVRAEWGVADDALVFGMIARLMPVKNHSFAVDLLHELAGEGHEVHLVLIGDGPLRPDLMAQAGRLKMTDRVHFLGVRDDVPRLLGGLDCILAPSLHEGMPLNLVEAQAAGVRCLVSDRITRECDMGLGLVEWLPIDCGVADWARRARDARFDSIPNPETVARLVVQRGYDVRAVGTDLVRMYRQDAFRSRVGSGAQ